MILITFKRNTENEISYVSIKGHAGYDEYGKDIVCSAVSALTLGTINGLIEYVGLDLKYNMTDDYTEFNIPSCNDPTIKLQMEAILETYYLAIISIEKEYSTFIKVYK